MAILRRVMKKTISSVMPLANNTTNSHRKYTSAIFSTPLKTSTTTNNSTTNLSKQVFQRASVPIHHNFSARAEKRSNTEYHDLLSVIESEIEREEEKFRKVSEAPTDFPFKLVHNAGERYITLTREYKGEEIKVLVEQLDDDDADMREMTEEMTGSRSVYMDVSVSNNGGLTLEFRVEVDPEADGIRIERLAVKNPNASYKVDYSEPKFSDLDENLQKAFYKYLEVRGFEPSTAKFLCDYRVLHEEHMKNTMLLQDLKNFAAG